MDTLFQEKPESRARPGTALRTLAVLVPYPVDKAYDYAVPEDLTLAPGDYVCVPLGNREVPAVVWGEAAGDVKLQKLKFIVRKYPLGSMPDIHRAFTDWVAAYTMAPKGAVLKMALSVPAALYPEKPVKGYLPENPPSPQGEGGKREKLTPARRRVLEALDCGIPLRAAELAEKAGCSAGVVRAMAEAGLLREVDIRDPAPCRYPDPDRPGPELSADQREIADHLCRLSPKPVLLDGVTGAGKTEVYFEAVAAALKQGRQVLILLPEIALSNVFLSRFESRFGCAPALWHSGLTPAQRRNAWRGVAEGHTKVVIGARSALFLPYQNLGLIVVDEEHDPAYKQEDGVIYHARDMAVVRAHLGKIPVILVSATPALETIHNAWNGRYEHLSLPDRFGGAHLPDIRVIDMRADKPERQHFISPTLKKAAAETLARGEQVLLFLNRRGYAPLTLCRTCGHRIECPRCTAWLVEHKQAGRLQCHHCGFNPAFPKACPSCGDQGSLAACGPGVERIAEEAEAAFPETRIVVLASDTAENSRQLRKILHDVRDRKYDIIIGTQIIAKGHHFPDLTCVGVIDADLGLHGGELRAAERTYQLLHQVAGRAGREEKKGRVYLQTWMPDNRIMQALAKSTECHPGESRDLVDQKREEPGLRRGGDKRMISGRDEFLHVEAWEREQSGMPPYGRLAGIIVSGRDEAQVIALAKELGRTAPQGKGLQTLGPAPAPLTRLRGRHRYRLLVRAGKNIHIQKAIKTWLAPVKCPAKVRIAVDIDPQSFL